MLAGRIIGATAKLRDDMEIFADRLMSDGIVDCVYNPLAYAWDVHVAYLEKSATAGARRFCWDESRPPRNGPDGYPICRHYCRS